MSETLPTSPAEQPLTPPPVAPDASAEPGLSEVARFVDTFVAPSKTMTDILRSSSWWLPFLFSIIVSFVFAYAVEKQVTWPQVVDNVLKQTPKQQERFASMEPAQASQAKRTMEVSYKYASYGTPLLTLLFAAIAAAVLLATVNFGFGGEATFGRMFAVWMYAGLPIGIKYLLAAIVLFAGMAPESFNLQNPVGTNIGYYLPPDMSKGVITLATSMDILTIWSVVIMIIGCSIVGKVKRSSATIAVVGWWVLATLAGTALAMVNS